MVGSVELLANLTLEVRGDGLGVVADAHVLDCSGFQRKSSDFLPLHMDSSELAESPVAMWDVLLILVVEDYTIPTICSDTSEPALAAILFGDAAESNGDAVVLHVLDCSGLRRKSSANPDPDVLGNAVSHDGVELLDQSPCL